jgi:hypothetical protein
LVISADDYFMKDGKYEFDASKLSQAHSDCQSRTQSAMEFELPIICVANTFTTEWEMRPYFDLAKKYSYNIFTIIVENRMNNINVHDVPAETLKKQKERFNIVL